MVVTQDFGSQANEQAQVVGVAYYDNSHTNFYQPGEGQGNVQIDAVNLLTGQVTSTQTWDSGGYELSLAPGNTQLIASLNDEVVQSTNITVAGVNIEQDVILNNNWLGGTREAAIAAAQPQARPGCHRFASAGEHAVHLPGGHAPFSDHHPGSQLDILLLWMVRMDCQRRVIDNQVSYNLGPPVV